MFHLPYRYRIRPRLLRNVAHRNMSLTMLGQPVGMPLGISPVAFQKMAHPDGEVGTARGTEFINIYILIIYMLKKGNFII